MYSLKTNILNFLKGELLFGYKKNIYIYEARLGFSKIYPRSPLVGVSTKIGSKRLLFGKCTPHCFCMTFEQSNLWGSGGQCPNEKSLVEYFWFWHKFWALPHRVCYVAKNGQFKNSTFHGLPKWQYCC